MVAINAILVINNKEDNVSCDETPEGVSEVILYLLDRLSRGEQMKIKFYRNGEIKLMGYSAEVRLYGTSQRGCSSHLSSREKEEEISEAGGGEGDKT